MNYRFGQKETKKKNTITESLANRVLRSDQDLHLLLLRPLSHRKPRGRGDGRNDSRVTVPVSTPDTANLHRPLLPPPPLSPREKRRKRKGKRGGDSIYKNKPLGMGWGRKGRRKVATLDLPRECVSPPPPFPFFSSDFVCWWLENGWEDQESSLFPSSFFWKRKPLQGLKEKKKIC